MLMINNAGCSMPKPLLVTSIRSVDLCDVATGIVGTGLPRTGPGKLSKFKTVRERIKATAANSVASHIASALICDRAGVGPFAAAPALQQGGSRSLEEHSTSRDKSLLGKAAKLKIYVIVLEEKGGVGKSVASQTCNETLKLSCEKVLALDADFVNKNLSRAGLTKAEDALDVSRVDFEGFLFDAADKLIGKEVDAVVIDSGAGAEKYFRPHLAELAQFLKKNGARLVVVRPITTSPLVHDNVMSFITQVMTPDMGVMLVRNMGQGRSVADYAEFDQSPEFAAMKAAGLAECILETAGARYSDLATSFGRSFAQIARLEPDELGLKGRHLEIARRVFTRPVRLFLARWLLRQTEAFRAAMLDAVAGTL